MKLRKTIQSLILETCCELENEHEVVDSIMGILTMPNSYPSAHTEDAGRMFDYGHTKSDSHEGRMTKAKLFRMGRMAQSFHDRLEDGDDLPQWVHDKVTTAEDRLRSAYDYIDYKLHRLKQDGANLTEGQVRRIVRGSLKQIL